MRHGGGGGGISKEDGEDVTGIRPVGMWTAFIPLFGFWHLLHMPVRWPRAFGAVCVWSVILLPLMLIGGYDVFTSTPGFLVLMVVGWYISVTHMKPRDYRPAPKKVAKKAQMSAALTKYDHLRGTTTWNDKVTEKK